MNQAAAVRAWRPLAQVTNALGSICAVALIFTLPNGRLAPRWTGGLLLYLAVVLLPNSLWRESPLAFSNWPGPVTAVFVFIPFLSAMIGLPLYRYWRVFTPTERQQAKWVVAGLVATAAGIIATLTTLAALWPDLEVVMGDPNLYLRAELLQDVGYYGSTLLIPLSIGVAILRSRLWDIDVIIRRTLVYSVLTGLLALVYFGTVVVLEGLLRGVLGGESQVAIVLSTLVIAALFGPLRARVQRAIDRRFFRQKYNAARTLAAFAAQARDVVELEQLTGQLVRVVDETMQPAHVGLWVRGPARPGERP